MNHATNDQIVAPIIHKVYVFYRALYGEINRFPKKDRYTIGRQCEQEILTILSLLFTANAQPDASKLKYLLEIDTKLSVLKTLLRLAHDVQALKRSYYLGRETELQEIGRMLGGWIKYVKR